MQVPKLGLWVRSRWADTGWQFAQVGEHLLLNTFTPSGALFTTLPKRTNVTGKEPNSDVWTSGSCCYSSRGYGHEFSATQIWGAGAEGGVVRYKKRNTLCLRRLPGLVGVEMGDCLDLGVDSWLLEVPFAGRKQDTSWKSGKQGGGAFSFWEMEGLQTFNTTVCSC